MHGNVFSAERSVDGDIIRVKSPPRLSPVKLCPRAATVARSLFRLSRCRQSSSPFRLRATCIFQRRARRTIAFCNSEGRGGVILFFCPARLPRVEIRAIMWESAKEEKDVREWKAVAPGPYVRCMLDSRRDELSAR